MKDLCLVRAVEATRVPHWAELAVTSFWTVLPPIKTSLPFRVERQLTLQVAMHPAMSE